VTFDDAFGSVLDLAYPILSELDVPGTVFVPTVFPDEDRALAWSGIDHWARGPHAGELAALSWADLRLLADDGWEIGSHTRSHPRLTLLDDAGLADELLDSREACERELGRPCASIAYPYGDVDVRVVNAARAAGYQTGGTLPSRLCRGLPLSWPRIGVYHRDDLRRFRLKTSGVVRGLRTAVEGRRHPSSASGLPPQTFRLREK
jgi:peptidoglycan/xylan/chitin deacetylase (PgdA/CDA1 family)